MLLLGKSVYCQKSCVIGTLDDVSLTKCGEGGHAIRCNSTGQTRVPDSFPPENASLPACLLDLSFNKISNLTNYSFINKTNMNTLNVFWLYLQYNNLAYIDSRAFEGLVNLVYLNLSCNTLTWKDSFAPFVFSPLVALQNLNLKENMFNSFEGLDIELAVLKNLEGLFINPNSPECTFGPNFQALKNLKNLSLSGVHDNTCLMNYVHNATFKHLAQLKRLFMSNCNISVIEAGALKPLVNLTDLDISYNIHLTFEGMNVALGGLQNTSSLKRLRVNRIHEPNGLGIGLKAAHFEHLKSLRGLHSLHMDLNKIEVLDTKIFTDTLIPRSLRHFTLSGNRLTYDRYIHCIHLASNVTSVDISRQYLNYDPFFQHDDKRDKTEETFDLAERNNASLCPCDLSCLICLPPHVRHIKWRKSFFNSEIPKLYICGADSVEKVDMSFNIVHKWNGPVDGFPNLTRLDLSENICSEISEHFLESFPKLEVLNISKNNLMTSFDPVKSENASKIFKSQRNLTHLIMSENNIYTLPADLFHNTTKLKYLDLSKNNFEEWRAHLYSPDFEYLDLTENKLRTLPAHLYKFLDERAEESNRSVMIKIGHNRIDCSQCDTLNFLRWMVKTKVIIEFTQYDTCLVNERVVNITSRQDVENIVGILENIVCKKQPPWIMWTIDGACLALGCILTSVLGTVIYKKRWKLRYVYYTRKRRYSHEGFERIFSNDAYISYAKRKAKFIYDTLVPVLEGQYGLKVWVTDRDSAAGVSIAENIVYGICNSRKTILLIDENFLKDTWCDYDMNMALVESVQTKRNAIIIVLIDSVPMSKIPEHVLRFLANEQSIEYPQDDDNLDAFWSNLVSHIKD